MLKPSLFVILVFITLISLHIFSLTHRGLTYDEMHHFTYGQQIALGHSDKIKGQGAAMPFSAFNVIIPRWFGNFQTVFAGRYVTVFFSLILALLVMRWASELYGLTAGMAALLFFCFDPNIIAHSQLVTADLYAALMITASSYFFWHFMRLGGLQRGILCAVILGIAQLAKYTCLCLYPLFFVFVVIIHIPWLIECIVKKEFRILFKKMAMFVGYCILFITVGLCAINTGFYFNKTGTSLRDYHFTSPALENLQATSMARIPLPLPMPYLDGLDRIFKTESKGAAGNLYLLGQIKPSGHGNRFNGYYFWALLFKTPIALMIIFCWAWFEYFQRGSKSFFQNECYIFLPVIFYLISYNYFVSTQVGIRHILYVFPLCWIFAASVFMNWDQKSPRIKATLGALSLYLLISTLSYFPHFISYFNEFVWDRKKAYKILADSNLDWGGYRWYKDQYFKKHPDTIYEPSKPTIGHIMVGANSLTGVFVPQEFKWLRENYEPIDQVAYAYLIYDVTSLKNIAIPSPQR